jgi:hypothetical protein
VNGEYKLDIIFEIRAKGGIKTGSKNVRKWKFCQNEVKSISRVFGYGEFKYEVRFVMHDK